MHVHTHTPQYAHCGKEGRERGSKGGNGRQGRERRKQGRKADRIFMPKIVLGDKREVIYMQVPM